MSKKYFLGLDMGTSSVGWAVTDEEYKLLRAKGKDLWGIREFEEALTSVERRTNRVSRRRRQREVARIGLIKKYFDESIKEVDPNFFARLDNSKYLLEDKDENVRIPNVLFDDPNYTDKDYFKEYHTIFHLRKDLIENNAPHDVRLVYLAILNLFKHRGHFLNTGLSVSDEVVSVEDAFIRFVPILSELTGIDIENRVDYEKLTEYLTCRDYSRTKKSELVCELLGVNKKEKEKQATIYLICGRKVDVKKIFTDIEDEDSISLCFADYNYDEKADDIKAAIGEERFAMIEAAHYLYNSATLSSILKGHKYLSEARVEDYEKHSEDLKLLKKVIKRYDKTYDDYNYMFRKYEEGTYSAYIGSVNADKKERRNVGKRTRDDLYKTIKDILKKYPQDDDVQRILRDIDNENFLNKQLNSSNGVIPNQVHLMELIKILENAANYLAFLNEVDESGLTTKERIEKLFSFQIPYYIGPITEKSHADGGNGWVVRKAAGTVYPWNIAEKIDVDKTSERFIENLIRECSYLEGEKVIPKGSLLYEKYCVLNEINNIKIRGEKITAELKQNIYSDLFETGKKIRRKQIFDYLKNRQLIESDEELTGIDISINNSLSTWGKFLPIFGERLKEDKYKKMVEEIVRLSTIYGDAKKLLERRIKENYGAELDDAAIKRILGFKFKDWGRLSREFLELSGCNKETGEEVTIIRTLWETNYNLMEIINNDYLFSFKEELEKRKNISIASLTEFKYEDLEEMYFSAPVKRMVWQTILIIKEIEKVMGCPPEKLFVEMTRKDGDKVRTQSRKQKFSELYKHINENQKEWLGLIESADNDGTLKSKKMYLYLTQMGKCMYSGETINLDDLFNDNIYDIDHIYPRHFVKDDNIDNNLVLVKKQINNAKQDIYPLPDNIYSLCKDHWNMLKNKGLINEEKYNRLMSRKPFSDSQKADFIARQLVETAQGTKGVTELIKRLLSGTTTVVYSKASNVSEFRHQFHIPKSRIVNDFHHAHDAYLNIVVGNVYYTKFTQNPRNFISREYSSGAEYNLDKMFDRNVKRGDYYAWIAEGASEGDASIKTVKGVLKKQTPLLTRMSFEQHGAIAKATMYGKNEASPENYIPLKSKDSKLGDVTKYGGFTAVTGAYFFLVEYTEKGKVIRSLETLPIVMKDICEKNPDKLRDYCERVLGLENPVIRMAKIKYQSLIKINGYYHYISGKTLDRLILRNAVSLKLSLDEIRIVRLIEKSVENNKISGLLKESDCIHVFDDLVKKYSSGIITRRPNNVVEKIKEKRKEFCNLCEMDKCKILLQMIQLMKIGVAYGDLSLLKLAPKSGVMLSSKKISNNTECLLINQSVTGIFESTTDLLSI
ncbi:MAG: type II CRISPR RNA-guided endonuclease Cas9 [Lachnospiraceae bacterium]|nr:type II CRISPR RNA-guided endonuclease Cas9 [Lachnospiraceae bacterium]